MTKSKNTKNEQNCIKQNEKSFIQKDLSLTELWQKGELPAEWYYVKFDTTDNIYITFYEKSERYFNYCGIHIPEDEITEILAPVPSYDEWNASEKYNKYLEEKIKIYERKDKQATETSIAYNELAKENEELKEILERHKKSTAKAQIKNCDLEIINAQLKELLKEFELWFTGIVGNMNDKNVGEHNRNLPIGNFEYAFKVFSQKINKTLGEDK